MYALAWRQQQRPANLEVQEGQAQDLLQGVRKDNTGKCKARGRHNAVRTTLLKAMTSIMHKERPGYATVKQHGHYVAQHRTW